MCFCFSSPFFFGVCGKLDTYLVKQRNSRYDIWTRPHLQAKTHAAEMLGRVFVCQPSNQSDPLQTDISPTNPPSQLSKYCTVTVRAGRPRALTVHMEQVPLMVEMTICFLPGYTGVHSQPLLTSCFPKDCRKKDVTLQIHVLLFNSCSAHYTHSQREVAKYSPETFWKTKDKLTLRENFFF